MRGGMGHLQGESREIRERGQGKGTGICVISEEGEEEEENVGGRKGKKLEGTCIMLPLAMHAAPQLGGPQANCKWVA